MEKIELSKVVDIIGTALPEGINGNETIEHVAASVENVKPGSLYFALRPGTEQQAVQMGAAAVVSPLRVPGMIVQENPLEALNRLAAWYRQRFHTWIVAVTGSVGKTTVKELVHNILETEGRTRKSSWDLDGEAALPLAILNLEWADKNAVVEMGFVSRGNISHMSKIVRPSAAVITSLGTVHLDECGSMEEVLREKLSITDGMSSSAPLILNGDDELLQRACETVNHEMIFYSIGNPAADICAKILSQDNSGSDIEVRCFGKKQRVHVPLWGRAGVSNALAAISAGVVAGIDTEEIAASIASFSSAPHRQNLLTFGGVTVLDDSCSANPESVREALSMLGSLGGRRRIAVLGEMQGLGNMSEKAHRTAGQRAAQAGVDLLCCIGEHAEFTAEGAVHTGGTRAIVFNNEASLATYLQNDTRSGDIVLIKGSRTQKLGKIIDMVWGKQA